MNRGARFVRVELAGIAIVLAAFAAPIAAHAQSSFHVWLDLVVHGVAVEAPPSWLDSGTGRLAVGKDPERWRGDLVGEAQLGVDWHPVDSHGNERFAAHLHARARGQEHGAASVAGVVEAWGQLTASARGGSDRLRLRAGQLLLPTSRENVGPLWSSPYTFTLSALDSWVGEEVRPVGLLAEYATSVDSTRGATAGFCVFGGNDTSGALLAWRGWSMGDRLSTFDEPLPLPSLPSLAPGALFGDQDRQGTTPVGSDLDGRPGWAGYLRYREGDLGVVQVTHFDNRGDRALQGHEYAWDTRFDQLGVELHPGIGWTVAGEHLTGETAMGLPSPRAAAAFRATYLLLSWEHGVARASVRRDDFATRDEDHVPTGERSDEDGHAWTAALMVQALPQLSLGIEYVDAKVGRPALADPGHRADGGRAVTLGARYRFGDAP